MREDVRRIIVHVLLAAFVANAANKFFVPDLEYEAANAFYARIFSFQGDAPDQYRILPLLPLKFLCQAMAFNTAVLLYNFLATLFCLGIFARLLKGMPPIKVWGFQFGFAAAYIYTQYTGWRPDTMGLVLLAAILAWWNDSISGDNLRQAGLLLGIIALSFSRADLALALAFFYAVYHTRSWPLRAALVGIPLTVQALLQFVIFPHATYYTQAVMILDNLSGYYLVRNPATYILLAGITAFWPSLQKGLGWIRVHYPYFLFIFAAYFVLVLWVGRVNEFRIFLPFCPLVLVLWREMNSVK